MKGVTGRGSAATSIALLHYAAHQAAGYPFFLAGALADYQRRHGLTDADLAGLLGLDSPATLWRVCLCRRPASAADFERIAEHFGIDAALLASVLAE